MKHFAKAFLKVASLVGGVISISLILVLFAAYLVLPNIPQLDEESSFELEIPFQVYTRDGKLIGEFGKERRIPISYDEAPEWLVGAILAAEDDSFFEHPGIDIKGIVRALLANVSSGQKSQGASTITMQVARNYFLSPERTYKRKLNELFLALSLERSYTKQEILELYLNKIFLGHRSYGFAAAAQVYYGKTLDELDLAQISMLAGLPKAPSTTNPISNPERARVRRNYVLTRMLKLDVISTEEFQHASDQPLTAYKHTTEIEFDAPYMAEMVRQNLFDQFGEDIYGSGYKVYTTIDSELQAAADSALRHGLIRYDRRHGYRMPDTQQSPDSLKPYGHLIPAIIIEVDAHSAKAELANGEIITLDWENLKWSATRSGSKSRTPTQPDQIVAPEQRVYLEQIEDDWRLAQLPAIDGAIVALDPKNGAIKALTGGFDFKISKFNRVTQAHRQAGSNIKPFIYSAALEKGYSASSSISAGALAIKDISLEEGVWNPNNYAGKFFGYTSLRKALSKSLNLVSVRLLQSIGIETGINHLSRFNFNPDNLPRGLSLALGSADVTPLEIVSSYAVFANGGYRIQPFFIDYIIDSNDKLVARSTVQQACPYCLAGPAGLSSDFTIQSLSLEQPAKLTISPANAFVMTDMLREVVRSGTAVAAKKLNRNDLGGKTGTTNEFKDAWFSGFNQELVATVWAGFDNPKTLGKKESAARVALPIWIDFMETALKDMPETRIEKPDNIRQEDGEFYIVSNRPEFESKTFRLDKIQTDTEHKAEELF